MCKRCTQPAQKCARWPIGVPPTSWNLSPSYFLLSSILSLRISCWAQFCAELLPTELKSQPSYLMWAQIWANKLLARAQFCALVPLLTEGKSSLSGSWWEDSSLFFRLASLIEASPYRDAERILHSKRGRPTGSKLFENLIQKLFSRSSWWQSDQWRHVDVRDTIPFAFIFRGLRVGVSLLLTPLSHEEAARG